jgi:F0F1-type ATP synthase epsilon subunit
VSPKLLHLKVVLPSQRTIERTGIVRLEVPTPTGLFHVSLEDSNLMAALVPGMVVWKALGMDEEERLKLEHGVLIKAGANVLVMTQAEPAKTDRRDLNKNLAWKDTSEAVMSKMKDGHIESVVKFDWR